MSDDCTPSTDSTDSTGSTGSTGSGVEPAWIDAMVVDWHGCLRSKRLPLSQRDKLAAGKVRLPLSTQAQDIGNDDRDELIGLALSLGDPDGFYDIEPRTLRRQPWNEGRGWQALASLHDAEGQPSVFDSRAILKRQIERFAERGWHAVVALELEFYLLDGSTRDSGRPSVPACLNMAGAPADNQLCEPRAMDRIDPFLARIHRYAEALDLPAETMLAEIGPGQFEINLTHRADPLHAADDALLFKRAVDRAAFDEGFVATFMALPYAEHAGSGQHVHLSIVDAEGNNIFDAQPHSETASIAMPALPTQATSPAGDTTATAESTSALAPSPRLKHAVAGLLDTLDEAQLLFAPNGNSYRRIQPGEFAPSRVDWGHDHRGVAIRLPEISGPGARLEHRVAGADANCHLVVAAIMAGVLQGLDHGAAPSVEPLQPGNKPDARHLHHDWLSAIGNAEGSPFLEDLLGDRFLSAYVTIKRHEAAWFNRQVGEADWQICLPRV